MSQQNDVEALFVNIRNCIYPHLNNAKNFIRQLNLLQENEPNKNNEDRFNLYKSVLEDWITATENAINRLDA